MALFISYVIVKNKMIRNIIFFTALLFSPLTLANESCQTNWIQALISEYPPPQDNVENYVKAIHMLAPNLKEIYLSGDPRLPNEQMSIYENTILELRKIYPNLTIGYKFPSLVSEIYQYWNCKNNDLNCMLKKSISQINQVNQSIEGEGFNAFLFYAPNQDLTKFLVDIKRCFPVEGNDGSDCPAGPSVTSSGVNPFKISVMSRYNVLGPLTAIPDTDAQFLEFYNIFVKLIFTIDGAVCFFTSGCSQTNHQPFFPYTTTDLILNKTQRLMVADSSYAQRARTPMIPDNLKAGESIYTTADPSLSARFFSFVSLNKLLEMNRIYKSNQTALMTLSGEGNFLGSQGWTIEKLCQFHQNVFTNYQTLSSIGFTSASVITQEVYEQRGFAIWNFIFMLRNVCPDCGL